MWLQWVWDGLLSGATKVVGLWWLVPLFVVIQLLKDSGWLDKLSDHMRPLLKPLRLPGEAGLPVVAGLAVGITYGAGIFFQVADEGKLTRDELTTAFIFLGICHAVIEETILFTALGINGLLLLFVRLVVATLFGYAASRWLLPTAPKTAAASAR